MPGKNAAETVEVVDLGLNCKMLLDKMQNVNDSDFSLHFIANVNKKRDIGIKGKG